MSKFNKRSIDLPKGCKELYDVLEHEKQARLREAELRHGPLPPISRRVQLPATVTVQELAKVAEREPLVIIADLLKFSVMAMGLDRPVGFERAATLLLTYGIEAQKGS
jgi:hypothetical protein